MFYFLNKGQCAIHEHISTELFQLFNRHRYKFLQNAETIFYTKYI